jgi:hypothetical protein
MQAKVQAHVQVGQAQGLWKKRLLLSWRCAFRRTHPTGVPDGALATHVTHANRAKGMNGVHRPR